MRDETKAVAGAKPANLARFARVRSWFTVRVSRPTIGSSLVPIGSNSDAFIDTTTNAVKHINYVGASPHAAFFTPDGSEV